MLEQAFHFISAPRDSEVVGVRFHFQVRIASSRFEYYIPGPRDEYPVHIEWCRLSWTVPKKYLSIVFERSFVRVHVREIAEFAEVADTLELET